MPSPHPMLLQIAAVYLFGRWFEARQAPPSTFVVFVFVVLSGNVAYVHARVDAASRLMSEDEHEV